MKYLQFPTACFLAFVLQSCLMGADRDTEKIVGSYYISCDYGFKNVHLGFEDKEWGGIGLIVEPIIAIGHNDQYIIVKREKGGLEYFVLRITDSSIHSEAENNMIGPLTEDDFNKVVDELNLEGINWTREFDK